MTEVYHHGVRVLQQDSVYSPIETTDSSTIGLLYTAPDADPDLYPYHVPKLFLADRFQAADLGSAGTAKDAFDGIYDHIGVPIVGIRIPEAVTVDQQLANAIGTYATRQGANALYSAKNSVFKVPKILIAPGLTHQRVTGGITQITLGSGGSGYTAEKTSIAIDANGYGGGARAHVVVRNGVITEIVVDNCGLGYNADGQANAPTIEIVGDGENATISGFQVGTAANPVVSELGGIANRLRATIIADCPNGTAEQEVAYRSDWATERILPVGNWGLVTDPLTGQTGQQPNSARIAGLLAKVDNDEGFWVSPSNHVVNGIVGMSRSIDDSGVGGELDYLNQNAVGTITKRGQGLKFMGARGANPVALWQFFHAGRVRDVLYDSIETSIDAWATDRPLNLQFFEAVAQAVNEKLRYWRSIGALIGGKCWVDPALNPPGQLVLGKPKFSMNFEPVGVAEDIQIIAAREPGYYADLVNQVVLALG